MALPGHSPPPPYAGPGSPPRSLNGYPESQPPYPMYGPQTRPMLPPSPQHFPSRYSQAPPPAPLAVTNVYHDSRAPPPPQKRPGSSMSISSMLGAEPERPAQEQYSQHNSRAPSRQTSISGPPMSLGAVMSPPQYPSKPNWGEYSYKPRSQTPDRTSGNIFGSRPHRSNSGSMMQRPGPFYEPSSQPTSIPQPSQYGDPSHTLQFSASLPARDDLEERVRRTSISGILQRPESQPQPVSMNGYSRHNDAPVGRPESAAATLQNGLRYGQPNPTDSLRPMAVAGSYDTRPPSGNKQIRPAMSVLPKDALGTTDKPSSQSLSPDLRRPQLNGSEARGLAGLLNQSSEIGTGSQNMARQDSVQSQSDRSMFGDRYRHRPFSPFTGSVASQNMSTTSAPADDLGRKGSDELSQHRAILGLAAESKRGRYSPLPQAVQGAQAQTPVPDAGIKTEHGRVFAGLGTGIGTTSAGPSPTPGALPASPFKQNDGAARLSEENLMKMSRSTSGISKRPRKFIDDDARAESELGDGRKAGNGRGNKRSKHGHSYKFDQDDGSTIHPRKSTPMAGTSTLRRTATPTNGHPQQLHHHHHLQRQTSTVESAPLFKPKKTVKISAILNATKRLPRRHVGAYTYDPDVSSLSSPAAGTGKLDVSIRPNLLPSMTDADKMNCTYTVRIPKLWLQKRERGLICREGYLWGSGIYSDDSDVVAAAMHAGFIHAVAPKGVDQGLLDRISNEQNTKIEGLIDLPKTPIEPEEGKDAILTLVILPTLDRYPGSARFGIQSRFWPEGDTKTVHDGVSFMILKIEFVMGGVESRRMGRTGLQKRARLQRELEERKCGEALQREMIKAAKTRLKQKQNLTKPNAISPSSLAQVTTAQDLLVPDTKQTAAPILNVGQTPDDWLRQVEAVAAA